MNWNAIRTYILGSGILVVAMPYIINFLLSFLGCTGDNPLTQEIELTLCTGGSLVDIPVKFQAGFAALILAGLGVIKAKSGTGTWKQNLFGQIVPVVPASDPTSGPGNVTPQQVAEK